MLHGAISSVCVVLLFRSLSTIVFWTTPSSTRMVVSWSIQWCRLDHYAPESVTHCCNSSGFWCRFWVALSCATNRTSRAHQPRQPRRLCPPMTVSAMDMRCCHLSPMWT